MGEQATTACGGFVGYSSYSSITIKDCLYAPAALAEGETAVSNSYTFAQLGDDPHFTLTNSYFTQPLGTEQGKLAYHITGGTGVTVTNTGTATDYDLSGLTSYGTGIQYDGTLYAGYGDAVNLNVAAPVSQIITAVTYTPEGGTATVITPADGVYSFTMPDANVVINATLTPGCTLDIAGYGDSDGGYVLIASPVGTVSPGNVSHMLDNDFDRYRFNQAVDKEWENYKALDQNDQPLHPDFTTLESGRGYLYASKEDVTLIFSGTLYDGEGTFDLEYSTENPDEGMHGWNLIGNPFATEATIDQPFMRMNDGGTALSVQVETGNTVAAMEGVFVQATATDQTASFTKVNRGRSGGKSMIPMLNISLSRNRGEILANAIVRFDGGQTLGCLSLREDDSKFYIPQNGKDYASRFRLVFSTEAESGDACEPSFAFVSNGNIIVNGEGLLQVVDVMGRVIVCRDARTCVSTNGMTPGVYVLRLINGNDVKTQKIVIE